MRKCFKRLFLIIFALALIFLTAKALLTFVYKIKEPYFRMPIEGKLLIRHDSYGDGEFGAKRKNKRLHEGLDIAAKMKTPVYASKSGWARTLSVPGGYGNLVIISHPGGWQTRYGHLDKIDINNRRWIRQGQVIGTVGKTGNAADKGMASHLHFEIRKKAQVIDPEKELLKSRLAGR